MRYRIAIAIPILAASALLSGCGTNADFGRVRPTMYNDDVHAWMGPVTTREYGDPPWRHTLTDEERRLRDLAYPLIDPPYEVPTATVEALLSDLLAHGWTSPGTVAVLERPAGAAEIAWPSGWSADKPRRYGDTRLEIGTAD